MITVGILFFNGKKYLKYLAKSIKKQNIKNMEVLILDNSPCETFGVFDEFKKIFENTKIYRKEKNTGFSAGHNFLLSKSNNDFYFCLNQDVVLGDGYIKKILNVFKEDEKITVMSGKIKKWDFENGKFTNKIDSVFLKKTLFFRFINEYEGEEDSSFFDVEKQVFGFSAVAIIFRKKNFVKIFDEDFFMYKEDVDLAIRLNKKKLKSIYLGSSVAYHDRSVVRKKSFFSIIFSRKQKSKQVKKWSFLNQKLLLKKHYKDLKFYEKVCSKTFDVFMTIYVFLFEKEVFEYYKKNRK